MQTAFGWDGEHLHRFVIHGVEYGIGYVGGVGFRDDPHLVRLVDLGLRPTERFVYDYDFTDGWRLDLRLEPVQVMDPGRVYPRCTGGRRAGPPEGCGGVQAFLEHPAPSRAGRGHPCGRDPGHAPGLSLVNSDSVFSLWWCRPLPVTCRGRPPGPRKVSEANGGDPRHPLTGK